MEAVPATPPASDPIIEVTDLVKEYRGSDGSIVRAVAGLSLAVAAGEIVGLLGANGAGKTTTLRIIATLLKPTAGTARVCGHDSIADPVGVRRSLGYVSATTGVPDRLTARELLSSFGRLNGLTDTEVTERVDWLINTLRLTGYADRPAGRLSSGQRQRISLGRAMVHDPPALVLDEPTNALDVVGSRDLLDTLERLRETGHAILLSTHRLHEIEHRCNRFVVINAGRVVAAGTRAELVSGNGDLEAAFFRAVEGGTPA
jgi:sodium transport system ATP-binding protein